MKEKPGFFAVIPIHGRNAVVEGESMEVLHERINKVLETPEKVYPFHNFRTEITVIKGRKVNLPHRS